jgi:hypothetical protein
MIDPYNYFQISSLIEDQVKISAVNRSPETMSVFNMFWKTIQFKREKPENVILGDSRVYMLDTSLIEQLTNQKYFNFGIPGGNCRSIIETFWFCDKYSTLKNVYIAISFHTYNGTVDYDIFSEADAVIQNPLLYFNNQKVITESVYLVKQQYNKYSREQEEPKTFKKIKTLQKSDTDYPINEKQWNEDLNREWYRKYQYPWHYHEELKKISDYCRNKHINLFFISFPSHVELQYYQEIFYGLKEEKIKFKSDIQHFGKLFDFDYPNDITKNKKNYADPLHVKKDVLTKITKKIWGKNDPS